MPNHLFHWALGWLDGCHVARPFGLPCLAFNNSFSFFDFNSALDPFLAARLIWADWLRGGGRCYFFSHPSRVLFSETETRRGLSSLTPPSLTLLRSLSRASSVFSRYFLPSCLSPRRFSALSGVSPFHQYYLLLASYFRPDVRASTPSTHRSR